MSDMTRRNFLTRTGQGLALAGIGATLLHTSAKAEEHAPDKKLGFAFVGLGSFALRQLIPNIDKCKHAPGGIGQRASGQGEAGGGAVWPGCEEHLQL